MALDLSNTDHRVLDIFLNTILDGYRAGSLTQLEARATIAEAVALAANDNGNLVSYMKAKTKREEKTSDAARSDTTQKTRRRCRRSEMPAHCLRKASERLCHVWTALADQGFS
jgi:hypothetical protein